LTVANLAATVLRFALLRLWFHHRRPRPLHDARDHEVIDT
jgi:hypothetical protein